MSYGKRQGDEIRVVIGAGEYAQNNPGWLHTQEHELNLLNRADWERRFSLQSVSIILAEHVWEHLTFEEGIQAAKICFDFLKPGGFVRCAVPDGFFPNETYQKQVQIGGPGPKDHPAASHKIVYTYQTITKLFETAGFEIQLLEYFDEHGKFHFHLWDEKQGFIYRSYRFDHRNSTDHINFASLIVDARKTEGAILEFKEEIEELVQQVSKVKDGFKPIQAEAEKIFAQYSTHDCLQLAQRLYASEVHQARMLATLIWGKLAALSPEAIVFLKKRVSSDDDWRVQEMLAMAFDTYCKAVGYEKSLPTIKEWLGDHNHNVRRAVSEGLRIWTQRDYFKQHPDVAIQLLGSLKDDDHEYVRKSAGNALRDVSRFHKDLVQVELETWDISHKKIAYTYKLASKFLQK